MLILSFCYLCKHLFAVNIRYFLEFIHHFLVPPIQIQLLLQIHQQRRYLAVDLLLLSLFLQVSIFYSQHLLLLTEFFHHFVNDQGSFRFRNIGLNRFEFFIVLENFVLLVFAVFQQVSTKISNWVKG